MLSLEAQIESILLFKNEPVSISELANWLEISKDDIKSSLVNLEDLYKDRGIVIISLGEKVSFGTHPEASNLIEGLQKEEFSKSLGKAGLETLAIILYKGPISRREVDHIRGVNSSFIVRNLLIRGLIERHEDGSARSHSYKPTLKLLEYLGVRKQEDLPEYNQAFQKIEEFMAVNKVEKDE